MGMKTVFFDGKSDAGFDYIKAIVREEDVKFFHELGAVDSPDDFDKEIYEEEEVEEKEVEEEPEEMEEAVDGDKGAGKPGTYDWHVSQLNSFHFKKEIEDYVKLITDKELGVPSYNTVATLRSEAKKLIKEFLENDSKSQ